MPTLTPPPAELPPHAVKSKPPSGKKKITNIYWDPDTEEYVFDYED